MVVNNLQNINFGSGKFSESYQDNLLEYIYSNIIRLLKLFQQWSNIPVDNKNSNISRSFLICSVVEAQEISK